MWKDCQNHKNNTQQNPPYVFSALQIAAIPASRPTTPLPYVLNQNSHGRNYMVLAAELGCGWSVVVTTYHYMLPEE